MSLPIPNLDDKTFKALFEEARALIPRYAPGWTEHNFSDPGLTFIDLFAWLAEMQIYHLNRITDKNILKFLKLLGETLEPAKSAKVDVTFTLPENNNDPVFVPHDTQVAAINPTNAQRIIFETDEDLLVIYNKITKIVTWKNNHSIDNTDANNDDNLFYFVFGENPAKGDKFWIGFDASKPFPEGKIKLTVNVYDSDLSKMNPSKTTECTGIWPSVNLEWQYRNGENWYPLDVEDNTAAFTISGNISFYSPEAFCRENNESIFWIRACLEKAGYEIPPRIHSILINTVAVSQKQTIQNEYASGNALPFQSIKLKNKPVIDGSVKVEILEENSEWIQWTKVRDFDASQPDDRHFMVDLQQGLLLFGDGINGSIPPAQKDRINNIKVLSYCVGGGTNGNINAKTIQEIVQPPIPKMTVVNKQSASGGSDAENLPEAKSRVRRDLKTITRAITLNDFETLAAKTPGVRIARIQVLPSYHPYYPAVQIPGAVTIVVIPEALPGADDCLPVPGEGFLRTIYHYLKPKTLVTTNLHVIGPEFIKVDISASIRIQPRLRVDLIKEKTTEALTEFLHPLYGGIEKKGWSFGRSVYKSEIYQIIEQVKGVTCVDSISLSAKWCTNQTNNEIVIPKIGLVYSGTLCLKITA